MEKKKTLKGFTLIELIIVLAIFSVILALVMSFIDPVSDLMKKTSIKERTAAYSDNIGEYIDKSIHYAKFISIYDKTSMDDADKLAAAKELFKDNLEGVVPTDPTKTGYKDVVAKVHVLEFMNNGNGQIKESVYRFEKNTDDDNVTTISENVEVLNPEHFETYQYNYSIGYCNLSPIADPSVYKNPNDLDEDSKPKPFKASTDYYYNRIVPMEDTDGNSIFNDINIENFAINIIACKNEAGSRVTAKDAADVDTVLYKSPCHMTTVSMAFVNAIKAKDMVQYYKKDSNDNMIPNPTAQPYKMTTGSGENICIVFILPYEINDTVL